MVQHRLGTHQSFSEICGVGTANVLREFTDIFLAEISGNPVSSLSMQSSRPSHS